MKTLTDMELRVAGFDVLAKVLGVLDAERFIALTIREPMDYTSWRETHMYLDDDIEAVAARAKVAAKEFDAMNGDYTRLQEGVFDDDVAREIDGKISAWKSASREPVLA